MKLTVQLLSCEGDKEGPNSDHPKGVSIAQGVPRGPFLALYIQNNSGTSAPIKRLTDACGGSDFSGISFKCGRLQTSESTETMLGRTGIDSTLCTLRSEKEISLERSDTIRLHDIDS